MIHTGVAFTSTLFFLSGGVDMAIVSTSPSSFMTTTEFLFIFDKICGSLLKDFDKVILVEPSPELPSSGIDSFSTIGMSSRNYYYTRTQKENY